MARLFYVKFYFFGIAHSLLTTLYVKYVSDNATHITLPRKKGAIFRLTRTAFLKFRYRTRKVNNHDQIKAVVHCRWSFSY